MKTIPFIGLLCLLLSSPVFAERFAGLILQVDTRIGTELSPINDGITDLPALFANETFQVELFAEGARGGKTRAVTITFDNSNNVFGEHFVIERVSGIMPQAETPGPTSCKICADFPVIVPLSNYIATVTLRTKKDIPAGLRIGFHPSRNTMVDERLGVEDFLSVGTTIIDFGRPDFDLFLDMDTSPGNQGVVESSGLTNNTDIAIQVFGNRIRFITGFILQFDYDETQLEFDSFQPGTALPNAQTLEPIVTQLDSPLAQVEVTAASFGNSANVENGLLGTMFFKPRDNLTRTGVVMSAAEIRRADAFTQYTTPLSIELSRLDADFDNDGTVGFRDFILFAEHFGTQRDDPRYSPEFDLVPDSTINFADFLLFTESLSFFRVTVVD